jgi:hypothetical protein
MHPDSGKIAGPTSDELKDIALATRFGAPGFSACHSNYT